MKIYFVRHGKTQWNQERRLQGMTGDSPLLPEALVEIAALGDYLADLKFDAIFSSIDFPMFMLFTGFFSSIHFSRNCVTKSPAERDTVDKRKNNMNAVFFMLFYKLFSRGKLSVDF